MSRYDPLIRQQRKRQAEMYGMDGVSLEKAIQEMNEAREQYVPKEFHHSVTFGHENVEYEYSEGSSSKFFVYWMSPETDQEYQYRVDRESFIEKNNERRRREQYEILKREFEK
jgi:hypothetical protein